MEPKRKLSAKEQKTIVSKTQTGGLNYAVGFNGSYKKSGKQCGGAAILRSDGKYHTEPLEELEKQGIHAI